MRPSEVTPLLGSQKVSRSTYSESSTCESASCVHGGNHEPEQQHHQSHTEARKVSLTTHYNEAKDDELEIPAVYESFPEASPPGCRTALFLVLLFSLFISNIEGSLLLATHAVVASDFGLYSQSQWLIVAYPLAVSAAEPVMGSLSDAFGRRRLLLICYVIFASAASVCGAAPHFSVFIIGRVMAGVGGSGMIAMVNLIVSDLVGLKDLASYRSYFQASMATGRLLGGPVGGLLVERLGWRLVFVAQTPILLLASLSCAKLIPPAPAGDSLPNLKISTTNQRHHVWTTLRQIDFGGAFLLVCTITLGLLSVVFLGDGYTIHDFRVYLTLGLCFACGGLLVTVERLLVSKPMLSRELLSNVIVLGIYSINVLGMIAQSSQQFILPLEEQILNSATADQAGIQLLPLVFGSIIGSMTAGKLIKRGYSLTKLCSTAMTISFLARSVEFLFWYSMSPLLRMLPLVVVGVSSSITFASTFIFLNAHVTKSQQAMAVSCLFCLYGIGSALGTTGAKVILNAVLRSSLKASLSSHDPNSSKIIDSLMNDHHFIDKLSPTLQGLIQQSVKDSFDASRAFSSAAQFATIPCILLLKWRSQKGIA